MAANTIFRIFFLALILPKTSTWIFVCETNSDIFILSFIHFYCSVAVLFFCILLFVFRFCLSFGVLLLLLQNFFPSLAALFNGKVAINVTKSGHKSNEKYTQKENNKWRSNKHKHIFRLQFDSKLHDSKTQFSSPKKK